MAGALVPHFAYVDVALTRYHRRVDHIHTLHQVTKQAIQRRGGEGFGVQFRHLTFVFNAHFGEAAARHLPRKAAQISGQLKVGLEACRVFRRHAWHVQRVGNGAHRQVISHLLGHLNRYIFLRFGGRCAQMRGCHHLLHTE